ncbi:hypothetical protein I6A84_22015 [Frankia sp. CNm7]|uniref:Uncharacterized protein n=2 Tax=Frankia nepalensis TaxID=1836974 RepID=A0A937RND1_9ACTN|nr:hypothetical protein [Frankia nepalensis]MBL7509874.1 hypothetical protein [Frankia nepalensis]MBL7520687.1 hypothetical protein [Frankia nepalensis]MBL7629633.1 hypothetical protein [Frankia nepalensis]
MAGMGAAALALTLAACGLTGGDDDEPTAPQGSPTTAITTVPVAPTTAPAPSAQAADFVLTTAAGLTGFAPATGGDGTGAPPFIALASCLGVSPADVADGSTDQAAGANLANSGTGITLWSAAQIVPAGQVERDAGLLRHPRFADCAAEQAKTDALAAIEASGATAFDAEAVVLETPLPAGALGRTSVVVVAGTSAGGQAQLFYDTVYLGSGQVEAQLHLVGRIDQPGEDLVNAAVAQLTAKLGQQ